MKQVLVIGGGSIGERHARCFQKTGRAEVSLCEINPQVRDQVAQRCSLRRTFGDFDEALQEPFDAAMICTPAHLHIPMARRLAERGVAMLIEKPLSVTLQGVEELAAAVEASRLPVALAYVYRAHPALAAMKAAIDAGRIGRPVEVVVTAGQHFPFYRPAYREIYYRRRETGGGAIQDALTHLVNAAEWLVGPVTRLAADAEHCVLEGVEVEDTVHMLARHGAVLGVCSLNQHQAPNEAALTVIGDRGAARFEMHRHRWLSCQTPGAEWSAEDSFALERDDLFIRQAAAFLDLLDGAAAPLCSLREGIQTLRVNLAALQSADERRWVSLTELSR